MPVPLSGGQECAQEGFAYDALRTQVETTLTHQNAELHGGHQEKALNDQIEGGIASNHSDAFANSTNESRYPDPFCSAKIRRELFLKKLRDLLPGKCPRA